MLRKKSISKVALHPLIKAWPDDTLGDIHEKLCKHNSVVVVDTAGQFKGIICRKDIVREMLSRPDWKEIPVTEVMITKVLYVPNHVSLAEGAKDMLDADIHQLVVTGPPEGGSVPIGILTLGEVVRNAI
jgi:signal-transduction protein with cAMP-binding, CBS, and nucleotidyltransferase domain